MSNEISDAEEFASVTPDNERAFNTKTQVTPGLGKLLGQMLGQDCDKEEDNVGMPTQWARHGAGFTPAYPTVPTLPSGCYDVACDSNGNLYCVPMLPPSSKVLELPEMRSDHVIKIVERFWDSENDYKNGNEFVHGGAAYRAGLMLFGPPGTGKTCTLRIVSDKLSKRNGVVFYSTLPPNSLSAFLTKFRRVEPDRKCIVVLEDIDSLIAHFGESGYLQLLDGAESIDNCLYIASTNYPERLDQRIYNRPGRFAHVVKIGLPGAAARRAFLNAILKDQRDVDQIVEKTEGFSIDHLSALVSGVYREKKDLHEEITRLRSLFRVPNAGPDGPTIGLGK